MEDLYKFIIPAVIGLISGVIGSLVAPWVSWGIEKQRERAKARQAFIKSCRELVGADLDKHVFRETAIYSQLRKHLSESVRKEIESDEITVQIGGRGNGINNYRIAVLDAVDGLERSWGLI